MRRSTAAHGFTERYITAPGRSPTSPESLNIAKPIRTVTFIFFFIPEYVVVHYCTVQYRMAGFRKAVYFRTLILRKRQCLVYLESTVYCACQRLTN